MNSIRSIFGSANPGAIPNIPDFMQKFQAFSKNPIGSILSMKNINVPQNFSGTPEDLAKYLLSSGQMSQEQFSRFAQMANQITGQH